MYAWVGLVYFPLSTELIASNTLSDLITLVPKNYFDTLYYLLLRFTDISTENIIIIL